MAFGLHSPLLWTTERGWPHGSMVPTVRHVVKLASSLSPCAALVSPSYYPTTVSGDHEVLLADWAALSSSHLDAAAASGGWFTATVCTRICAGSQPLQTSSLER
jgi:hypothetical protein